MQPPKQAEGVGVTPLEILVLGAAVVVVTLFRLPPQLLSLVPVVVVVVVTRVETRLEVPEATAGASSCFLRAAFQ